MQTQLMTARRAALAAALLLATPPRDGAAQSRETAQVTKAPGPQYEAGALKRTVLGNGWRDVWVTPVEARVLDPATYAGGLTLTKRGGFRQTLTAHFKEDKGRQEYVFRSVDKFPLLALAPEFQGSLAGRVVADQTSAFFPAAPLLVPPLLRSIGALHVEPRLYVMEDSPRLDTIRTRFAGMLGTFELKANEGPDDSPGFAGSKKIQDTEEFFEALEKSHEHRLDEREFLANRLIDFLINDTDRSPDNFQWARFGEKGNYTWRPIPRDRDWAFMNSRGLINTVVISRMYPKFASFSERYKLSGLVYSSHMLDRKLLQRLTSGDFHDVALRVRQAVTDSVIAQVVEKLPAEWRANTAAADRLEKVLRARRDGLLDVAMDFYADLASEVDVHGTGIAERAEIVRHDDGRVTVTITAAQAPMVATAARQDGRTVTTSDGAIGGSRDAYYQRTFVPSETNEIRVYLGAGDDVATIRGSGASNGAITVRVIGEKGGDVLADSSGSGGVHLYDADGKSHLIATNRTHVSTKPWNGPEPKIGLRLGSPWRPDWGEKRGWSPMVDYESGAGAVIGIGPRFKAYGFRRLPYHWQANTRFLYGTANGRMGLVADLDYRFENSPMAFEVDARATQIEAIRFFGYGNDSPDIPKELALVDQRVVGLTPALVYRIGWRKRESDLNLMRGEDSTNTEGLRPLVGKLRVGPTVAWFDPEPRAGAPLETTGVLGGRSFTAAGAMVGLQLDRTDDDAVPMMGWKLNAATSAYPLGSGLDGPFGTVSGSASAYVPLIADGLHLAVRAGGEMAMGDTPVQFSPSLGGKSTLRGYVWRRYTGDAVANAGAELRLPVGTVNFLLKSQLGVFALADAGRVWYDGNSDGNWHSAVGGGFWLAALGRSVSVAYAHGELGKFYFYLKTELSY